MGRPVSGESWVGIDLGTQSVRCLVVDAAGRVLGSGSAGLPEVRDGVEHTQHPDDWWEAVVVAVRGAGEGMAAAGRSRSASSCWTPRIV